MTNKPEELTKALIELTAQMKTLSEIVDKWVKSVEESKVEYKIEPPFIHNNGDLEKNLKRFANPGLAGMERVKQFYDK